MKGNKKNIISHKTPSTTIKKARQEGKALAEVELQLYDELWGNCLNQSVINSIN